MEPGSLKRYGVAAGALVAGLALIFWLRGGSDLDPPERVRARVPDGVRVKVEILNASGVRGQARRAMFALRDAGFDVVRFANDTIRRDSTLVLSRSGLDNWAAEAAKALGGARVESRLDSSRFLDVTVLLGADWRPPSKPFRP